MDRSLYPDGVEVRQTDLGNTENTRSFHILQRDIDNSSNGVATGLLVVPDGTSISISSGHGYAPNGEMVELLSAITGISLADYTVGIKNYVLLVYTETYEDIRPHKTSGDSAPTKAVRSYRLVVLTESAYIGLPATDSNLDNDATDRALLISIVTAQGSGISLISSNVDIPTNFGGGISANMTDPIDGVSILRIDSNTITGTGSLSYAYSSKELVWVAPEDTSGVPIVVGSGGIFVLTSQLTGVTLTVLIADTILPSVDALTDVLVSNIYKQNILRNTAIDNHHRSFIGSGIPAPNNPHGLTPGDLGLGETNTEFHQEVFHANGVSPDSNPDFLKPAINAGSIPHSIAFEPPILGDKVYLGGFLHTILNGASLQFNDVVDDAHALFETYAVIGNNDNTTTLEKHERVRYLNIPPPTMSVLAQLRDISDSIPAGTGQIEYTPSVTRLRFKAPGDTSYGAGVNITDIVPLSPGIIRLFSETGEYWIDVYADESANWSIISITTVEDLTFSTPLTNSEHSDRLKLSCTVYSGSSTGFLGNGFGPANNPNDPNDKRVQGLIDGAEIKAGFRSIGYGGIEHLNASYQQVSIGEEVQPHPTGRKTCLVVGDRNDTNSIPIRIQPVDALPTDLTEFDMGSLFFFKSVRRVFAWDGNSWRSF